MRPCEIGFAVLLSVFLGCSGDGGSQDAGGTVPDAPVPDAPVPDAPVKRDSPGTIFPAFDLLGPPDLPYCACEGPSSETLDGPMSVSCQTSPAYCAECPVPFDEPPECSTVNLHCSYGGTWCDCVATDGGSSVWRCIARV
jgi:hypothetical protein